MLSRKDHHHILDTRGKRDVAERNSFARGIWISSPQVPTEFCAPRIPHDAHLNKPFFFTLPRVHPRRKEATPVTYLIRLEGGRCNLHARKSCKFFFLYVCFYYHATPLHFHYCFVPFLFLITENGRN